MAEVHGSCDDRFAGVREALAQQLDGDELGASVAVDLDGETVVDLWGGYRDEERTTPWTEDTIVNVWSTTKCVLSPGRADAGRPRRARRRTRRSANYWPEFSAKGKEDVAVRHLMSHTSGVSGWEQPFSIEDMYDWETADRAARRAAAVVGAGHGVGLPRAQPGAPRRRGDPADHRADVQAVRRRGDRRPARRGLPDRRRARPTGTGSRRSSRRRRCRSTWRTLDPDSRSLVQTFTGPVDVGEGDEHAGVAARRPRRAERPLATRAGCSTCCGCCRSAARPAACGCCRRRRST